MYRIVAFFCSFILFVSCSSSEEIPPPTNEIPNLINGIITEVSLTPIDINTPDKGTLLINANNTIYKVNFNAVAETASNAMVVFNSDTILTDQSREFSNQGRDAVAYNPVAPNEILVLFNDGRKIDGIFNSYT